VTACLPALLSELLQFHNQIAQVLDWLTIELVNHITGLEVITHQNRRDGIIVNRRILSSGAILETK